MKNQGKRNDLTLRPMGEKLKTEESNRQNTRKYNLRQDKGSHAPP